MEWLLALLLPALIAPAVLLLFVMMGDILASAFVDFIKKAFG